LLADQCARPDPPPLTRHPLLRNKTHQYASLRNETGDHMTHAEILQRVAAMMGDLTEDDELVLTDETTPDDVELWDSLLHIRLVVAIESEFGIRFDTVEIGEPESVGELVALIERKLNSR